MHAFGLLGRARPARRDPIGASAASASPSGGGQRKPRGPRQELGGQAVMASQIRFWLVSGKSRVWVPESRRRSCDLLILLDDTAETVALVDLVDLGC